MIKTMIYPYDEESYPLVKFKNRLSEIEIVKTVSPKGWRFKENEINGIKVEYDFITALDECEAVWFVEPMLELPFEEMIIPKLDLAIQKNKSIIWTRKENLKCDKEYKRIEKETDGVEENLFESEELYKIDIPVIAVLGITERTNKYEIQLALQQELEMRGINTYILGSRNIPFFSRVFRIPEKLLNMQNDRYQILGFNHYVKRIEKVYQPDCIIVGVPGETSAFSTKIVNNFGMLCKKMLEAINPDLVVLSTADELFEMVLEYK